MDVSIDNYTAKSGSAIMTLKVSYLETLSIGTHTLKAVFTDSESTADFGIKASITVPDTGVR